MKKRTKFIIAYVIGIIVLSLISTAIVEPLEYFGTDTTFGVFKWFIGFLLYFGLTLAPIITTKHFSVD